ncbi:molybdenum cofactor biosynthesis protein MoaE [Photobacterium damselae subsp. damselae]|nr:molybdenum cofactor biosynthesis protein MoaE [Photobacterium damselae]UKA24314.1 molybdenum cofactor biosynthesis protein MoaE [Photobacterium damselae subsp. damselae]
MTEWKLVAQTRTTPVEQDDPVEIIVKCKHRDSALDVAEYIIDEIKRNSQSTYALKIKLANEYDAVEEERRWAIRMSKLNFFQRSANQLIKPNFVELEKTINLQLILYGQNELDLIRNGTISGKLQLRRNFLQMEKLDDITISIKTMSIIMIYGQTFIMTMLALSVSFLIQSYLMALG